MICPHCHGQRWILTAAPGPLLYYRPCFECIGGIASCCDIAGSWPVVVDETLDPGTIEIRGKNKVTIVNLAHCEQKARTRV